jgi:hypothetical protein
MLLHGEIAFRVWAARLLADGTCAAAEKGLPARSTGSSQTFCITGFVMSRREAVAHSRFRTWRDAASAENALRDGFVTWENDPDPPEARVVF